jgi:hypothetical protein
MVMWHMCCERHQVCGAPNAGHKDAHAAADGFCHALHVQYLLLPLRRQFSGWQSAQAHVNGGLPASTASLQGRLLRSHLLPGIIHAAEVSGGVVCADCRRRKCLVR